MIGNIPLKQIQQGDLTIEGFSHAVAQSCWHIPELKVGFDMGALPRSTVGSATWFLSHCRLNHAEALPVYLATRRLLKLPPPQIFLPAPVINHVHHMLNVWKTLDRSRMACELVGLKPGQEWELTKGSRP